MGINWWGVVVATIAQFVVGMVWYTAIFGKAWGKLHGFDKLSKEKQKEMGAKMGPWYGLQLVMTVVTATVLAKLLVLLPDYSAFKLAILVWLGLVFTTQFSAIVFGGTEPKDVPTKFAIMTFGSLACILVGVAILHAMM